MPMPFKPSTMTQGSGLSNSLAAFNAGGANWNSASKDAVKTNTARDSSSYMQRLKINAIGKSMNGVGLAPGEPISFKSSNSSWYTAYDAVRKVRRLGTAKLAVTFISAANFETELEVTRNCEGVEQNITRVENWIANGISVHTDFKNANNNADRKKYAYKVVNRYNKATNGIATVRECEPCVGFPSNYNVLYRKAYKADVIDFASRYSTPVSPVAKAVAIDSNCNGATVQWSTL